MRTSPLRAWFALVAFVLACHEPRHEHREDAGLVVPDAGITHLVPGAAAPASLHVATWNLRRLGHGDKRLDLIAAIMAEYDVVAVQEVMTPEGVEQLLAHLPGWKAELSPRAVGRGTYEEWYAVLYRSDRARVTRAFLAADKGDALAREPFVVCMQANAFDFCLTNVHIVYGRRAHERDAEIDALGHLVALLRARDTEKDWIVMGDFNRQPSAPGWERLRDAGWSFTVDPPVATSLGRRAYSRAYDHILIDPRATAESQGQAARFDLAARACAGDFERCSRELTDHAPMSIRFRTSADDD